MPRKLTVVVSQSQSKNPAKRSIEEAVVEALLFEQGIEVTIIPHLYDLKADSTGMLCLQGISGDVVIAAWLFPRAAHWILDRNHIRGRVGETLLDVEADDEEGDGEEFDDAASVAEEAGGKLRVLDSREPPSRTIYCLDLRQHDDVQVYVEEIKRLATSTSTPVVKLADWVQGDPSPEQMARYNKPTNDTALGSGNGVNGATHQPNGNQKGELTRIEEQPARRWYPVIDYARCTNCMECVDFCLFGVYGIDNVETILVEQPDNCRKGCPACSRVCPENAIIFPQHKTPVIAGSSEVDAGSLKIDLSKLFGGDTGESAEEAAARERDEQLLLAGRDAVGMSVGMPKRQDRNATRERDDLDHLIDELEDIDI